MYIPTNIVRTYLQRGAQESLAELNETEISGGRPDHRVVALTYSSSAQFMTGSVNLSKLTA